MGMIVSIRGIDTRGGELNPAAVGTTRHSDPRVVRRRCTGVIDGVLNHRGERRIGLRQSLIREGNPFLAAEEADQLGSGDTVVCGRVECDLATRAAETQSRIRQSDIPVLGEVLQGRNLVLVRTAEPVGGQDCGSWVVSVDTIGNKEFTDDGARRREFRPDIDREVQQL